MVLVSNQCSFNACKLFFRTSETTFEPGNWWQFLGGLNGMGLAWPRKEHTLSVSRAKSAHSMLCILSAAPSLPRNNFWATWRCEVEFIFGMQGWAVLIFCVSYTVILWQPWCQFIARADPPPSRLFFCMRRGSGFILRIFGHIWIVIVHARSHRPVWHSSHFSSTLPLGQSWSFTQHSPWL